MRILTINTIAGHTATGIICDSIAQTLIDNGHEVYMASGYGKSKVQNVKSIKIGNYLDRAFHALLTRANDSHGFNSTRATAALLEKILKIRPDLIHLHNLHGYYLNVKLLINFLKRASIPVVMTLHDCWILTGHCVNPNYAHCTKYEDGSCGNCPISNTYPVSFVDNSKRNIEIKKDLFSDFNNLYIVSVSEWLNNVVEQSWLNDHPHYTIHDGVDTDIFTLPEPKTKRSGIIGVANVWNDVKGFEDFYKLRNILPQNIKISLVGLRDNQIKKLPQGIVGYGYLEQQQLVKLYGESELLVSFSKGEAFGMSIAEAMSCGTPVFAYHNTAPVETVKQSTGRLIPDGDVHAMANAIINYDNSIKYDDCRNHIIRNFSKCDMVAKYMNLYESLLGKD